MEKIVPGVEKKIQPAQPTGPVADSVLNPPRLKSAGVVLS